VYTTDADLALDPALLTELPPLKQALERAGSGGAQADVES
jgi:hypothetical protein